MTLEETIPLMTSNDYRERLKAEYLQLKIRIKAVEERLEQLSAICPTREYDKLLIQRMFMMLYKCNLINIAKEFEGINLGE